MTYLLSAAEFDAFGQARVTTKTMYYEDDVFQCLRNGMCLIAKRGKDTSRRLITIHAML